MKQKLLIFGLILSVAINVGFLTTAAYYSWERSSRKEHHKGFGFLKQKLNLSESQLKQFESLKNSFDSEASVFKKELRKARIRLSNLLAEKEPDREEIKKTLHELEVLQADLQELVLDHLLQKKSILTPEQQEKFLSIISKRLCPGDHSGPGLPEIGGHKKECTHE